jgi:hypothetical protein
MPVSVRARLLVVVVRSRTSCSIPRAASTGSSCSQTLTASQPRRSELSIGVAVAADDSAEFQAPPAGIGLRQVTVLRARVPEAAVDEHRDPRPTKQDVDATTTVSTRNRSVDDEPQAPPMKSTAQCEFRAGTGSLGPLHHPPGCRRRCRWDQAEVEMLVHGTSISSRTDTSRRYGSPVRRRITTPGRLTGLLCQRTSRSTSSSSYREPCGQCASPPSDTILSP